MTISPKIAVLLGRLLSQLSQQSSLSGLIAICIAVGLSAPAATVYAASIVAIAGILKVLLPDAHASVIGNQTVNPTVVVNSLDCDVQS